MNYYGDREPGAQSDNFRETVYHAGNGFYSPYVEPLWKKEKRMIRGAGNGIGLAALGYIAISFSASAIFMIFTELFYPFANIHGNFYGTETIEWAFNLMVYIFSLMLPFGIYALVTKMPVGVAFPFRKAKLGLSVGGIMVALGTTVIASYATNFLQLVLEAAGIGITMPEYETPETLPGIILYAISLTVAPAFIEEIIFRGIVMQSLRRFGDVFALIASALIFGIFHLNLIQMPYAFILGLCIGYFVMRTGSLWVGVCIHFINNSGALIFEMLYPHITDEAYIMANLVYNLVAVILAVIALVLILAKYKDMFRFEPSRSALSSGRKTLFFLTSPALIIAMIGAVILTLPYIHLL